MLKIEITENEAKTIAHIIQQEFLRTKQGYMKYKQARNHKFAEAALDVCDSLIELRNKFTWYGR